MVIHEFLPAIVGTDTANAVYRENPTGAPTIDIKYYKPTNTEGRPFIPAEFSVAAYRLRPQHHPAALHRPGLPVRRGRQDASLNPSPACRCSRRPPVRTT